MPDARSVLTRYPAEDFLSTGNLDRADSAVTEIFAMMFGFDIEPLESPAAAAPPSLPMDERTAIVGFSGALRGSCQIRMTSQAAGMVASAMLGGAPLEEENDSINDALGELCNMLAGGLKNGIAGLSSECTLSPPTVICGHRYRVHMSKPTIKLTRAYRFSAQTLHLTLCCEDLGTP